MHVYVRGELPQQLWKLVSKEQQQRELLRAVKTLPASTKLLTTASDDPSITTSNEALPSTAPSDDSPTTTPNDDPPTTTPRDDPPTITSSDDPPTTAPSDNSPTITPSDTSPPLTAIPRDDPCRTSPSPIPPPATTSTTAQKPRPATVLQALNALACACSPEGLQDILNDNEGKVLGKTRLVHFIDTGGQAIYHDVHPVLITSPSIYLVVFNLMDVCQESGKVQLDYFRRDLIQSPLRSIYTFGTKNPHDKHLLFHPEAPTIFIVGTHLDQIPENKCKEFLEMLHDEISTEIGNKPYREFVQYDPAGQSFWAVDNTQAGREQDERFKKYISKLCVMVQEKSMEMSVNIPLPWFLLKLVMNSKHMRYCKYSELLNEARIRGYVSEHSPEADLDTMLKLFHILGLFYHKVPKGYKKENSLVFIEPNCLYSVTSDFLMAAKEEIEDSSEDQYQTQASTVEEIQDSRGGSEGGRHQTQAATMKQRRHGEESPQVGIKRGKMEWKGIVRKNKVIQRMEGNVKDIWHEMEAVLQYVKDTRVKIGLEPTNHELVLSSLYTQLKLMGQNYMLPFRENQIVVSMKDKQQLFIGKLVHSLASAVEAVLHVSGMKRDVHHVRREMDKAVENVTAHCQNRSIKSHDMDQFLAILSDLRIVAQLSDPDHYVAPAALPELPESADSIMDGILVTMVSQTIMQVCYLPSGLFCCLISELVTGLGWTVIPLGRTHVAFTHKGLIGKVHLIEHQSYIKIALEPHMYLRITQTCQAIRRSIHESIVNVYRNLFGDPTAGTAFEELLVWGFKCEEHRSSESHIAALQEEDHEECYAECLLQGCDAVQAITLEQMVWVQGRSTLA